MDEQKKIGVLLLSVIGLSTLGAACTAMQPRNTGTANNEPIVKTSPVKSAGSDKGDAVVTGGDLDFMNNAAPGGMAEVELGKLAAAKAQNAEVKAFAQKMIEDHSRANDELKQLAAQKKVMLPPDVMPLHKQAMEKLSKLSGTDFDKEYVKEMVTAHEKDVKAFETAANTGTDADVKAFAAKTLPTLKMHLEMIKAMVDKIGVKP